MATRQPKKDKKLPFKPSQVYILAAVLFLSLSAALVLIPSRPYSFVAEHLDAQKSGVDEARDKTPSTPTKLPAGGDFHSDLSKKKKVLYFVIDDAGHNLNQLQKFLEFPGKLTIAVIPDLPYSVAASKKILDYNKSLILHMPMEAMADDAGPKAIGVGDSPQTIEKKLAEALVQVPGARGVNNHMGSKATADPKVMESVLRYLQKNSLFFLDSKTSPRSTAGKIGRELNFTVRERDVFLDNEKTREFILQAMEEGKKIATQKGHAVMIGHVWTSELAEVLTEIYPQLLDEGYTLDDLPHLFALPDENDSPGY